jgi:hypothetical protein
LYSAPPALPKIWYPVVVFLSVFSQIVVFTPIACGASIAKKKYVASLVALIL